MTAARMTAVSAPQTHVSVPEVNLSSAMEVLIDAGQNAAKLHGQPMSTDRKEEAERNRELLHLADQLGLASSLVRNEYWHSRGRDSYDL